MRVPMALLVIFVALAVIVQGCKSVQNATTGFAWQVKSASELGLDGSKLSKLVLLQLNSPNIGQRMVRGTNLLVPIPEVAVDTTPTFDVGSVVGVRHSETLQHTELSLDQVQPRRLGRSPHWMDSQFSQQRQEGRVVVDVAQVVHDHE